MSEVLKNIEYAIDEKKINHAFLVSVDESYNRNVVISIIKKILLSTIDNTDNINEIMQMIDNNTFSDLRIINPSGKNIKKEQINQLISDFNNKSVNDNIRFYIIEFAEDLNDFSANALLKFLEEPENNIIAFLITKNINKVLSTIASRSQVLDINYYNFKQFDDTFKNQYKKMFFEILDDKSIGSLSNLYNSTSEDLCNILIFFEQLFEEILRYKYLNKLDILSVNEIDNYFSNGIEDNMILCFIKNIENGIIFLKKNVNTRIVLDYIFVYGGFHENQIG